MVTAHSVDSDADIPRSRKDMPHRVSPSSW
jgi:hypothetical protein